MTAGVSDRQLQGVEICTGNVAEGSGLTGDEASRRPTSNGRSAAANLAGRWSCSDPLLTFALSMTGHSVGVSNVQTAVRISCRRTYTVICPKRCLVSGMLVTHALLTEETCSGISPSK